MTRNSSRKKQRQIRIKPNNNAVIQVVVDSITPIFGLICENGIHYIIFKDSFIPESYLKSRIEIAKKAHRPNDSKEITENINDFIQDMNDMISRKEDASNKYLFINRYPVSDFINKFPEIANWIGIK
jgi:hypothetical protein